MDIARDLLFGVLALRTNLIDAGRFADACRRWANRKETPLAEMLVERGWVTETDRKHLDYLVERNLQVHGSADNAVRATADAVVWRALAGLDDFTLRRWVDKALPGSAYLDPDAQESKRGWGVAPYAIGVTVIVLLAVCLLSLLGTAALFARERRYAVEARMQAAVAADEAQRQRAMAEVNFSKAREAVDELFARAAEDPLPADKQPLDATRRQLLERALRFYQEFLKDKGGDAASRYEVAQACRRLGDIQNQLKQPDEAQKAFRQARELLERLITDGPVKLEHFQELANALERLGDHDALAKRAADPVESFPDSPAASQQFTASQWLARCVPLAEKDAALPDDERKQQARAYADRALDLLTKAEAGGYFKQLKAADRERLLEKDGAFNPLRERAEYTKLLEKVRASAPK